MLEAHTEHTKQMAASKDEAQEDPWPEGDGADEEVMPADTYGVFEPSDLQNPILHADTILANVSEQVGFAILRAATDGNLEKLKRFKQDHGSQSMLFRDSADMFPLLEASFAGKTNAVAWLVDDAGVQVDTAGGHKFTALHGAAYYGHRAACQALLKRGAKLWSKTAGGQHPSDLAHQEGHIKLAEWLDSWHHRNSMTGPEL
jgi:hypothetical protein